MDHHPVWLTSDPPGGVFRRLGGVRSARSLAGAAVARLQLEDHVRLFRRAFDQGHRESRWESVNQMAAFLGVKRSWLGRLIRGDDNVAGMRIEDLYRCAGMLRLHFRTEAPSPERIERHVLHVLVREMWERRRDGGARDWPDLQEDEAETIRRRAWRVGYIGDPPAREASPWQQWLTDQAAAARPAAAKRDAPAHLLSAVGLGDWLVVRPFLPLFESALYFKIYALHQIADDRNDDQLKKAVLEFMRPLAEAQDMLNLFRSTRNGTVEEVARKRNWRPATVGVRLNRLGLTAEDCRGEEAVLGRLIVRSPVLCPLYDVLLSRKEWSAESTDAPQEGRG